MTLQEFALGDSFLHRMDPRAKIIAAVVFSVVVAVCQSLVATAIALLFPVVLFVLSGMKARDFLKRLAVVNGLMLFLWLFLPFTTPGEPAFAVGPLTVTREGLQYAFLITLKSNVIIAVMMTLLGTSPIFNLVHALSHLAVPDKLVHLFFFCWRYVHVIAEEYTALAEAAKIRGFRPGTNVHTYRTYGYFVGMLLVRSFDRAQRIMDAMKCRGFNGKFHILHHYEMRRFDYILPAVSVLFAMMLMVVK